MSVEKQQDQKKVALFVPDLSGGGAERVMLTIANEISRQNVSVDLILAQKKGTYLSEVSAAVNIVNLNSSRVLFSLRPLINYLNREKPAVLLSTLSHANIIAIVASKLSSSKTKVIVREGNNSSIGLSHNPGMTERIIPLLMKYTYPMAESIIAISYGVADDLAGRINIPRETIHCIYNPAFTPDLLEKAGQKISHPWFEEGEPPVIVTAGRLCEQKNHRMLIDAFSILRSSIEARLLILGEGEMRGFLEKYIDDSDFPQDISMPGFEKNPFPYFKNSKLFVLSSKWEGTANVLIQSLVVGTPVVSTNCKSGPAEVLDLGKWGTLTPVSDTEALAKAMLTALKEQKKTRRNEQQVLEYCRKKFGSDVSTQKYYQLMTGAMS